MCMEDIRIAREMGGQSRVVAVAASAQTTLLPPDTKRISFTVGSIDVATMYVYPKGVTALFDKGYRLVANNPVKTFHVNDFGSLIWQEWLVSAGASTATAIVSDVSLDKK